MLDIKLSSRLYAFADSQIDGEKKPASGGLVFRVEGLFRYAPELADALTRAAHIFELDRFTDLGALDLRGFNRLLGRSGAVLDQYCRTI